MQNRPGIAHVSREERSEDDQECPDEGSALVIWHENYPFGKAKIITMCVSGLTPLKKE